MSEHIRRVASPEGAQYYGLPIGAPITADAKAAAKLKHGGGEPAGASKKIGNKGGNASAASTAKAAAEKAANAKPPKAPQSKTKVKKPSIKGNLHFKVGKTDYTAPNGSKLFHQKGVDGLAYVKTPDGKVHIFNENGEIETDSKAVLQALAAKFEKDLAPDDPDFEAVEFDKAGAHYSIDQMPVGSVLNDQRGNPVFTKNEDGTWHNEELNVDLDEKSVKPLYDSGDLVPENTPESDAVSNALADTEAVNFKELSFEEASAALEAMPEGAALDVAGVPLTKQPGGGWSEKSDSPNPMASSTLAYLKDEIKVSDGAQVTPDMAEDPKGAPAPKSAAPDAPEAPAAPKEAPEVTDRAAASKQAIADTNPYKPAEVNWSDTYPGNEQYSKETKKAQDILDAQPGDTMLAAYYSDESGTDLNDYYDIAVFTKQEDGTWWDQDSVQKFSDDEMSGLVIDPEVAVYPSVDNKGPEVARQKAAEEKQKAKEAKKQSAAEAAVQANQGPVDNSTTMAASVPETSPEGMVTGGSIKGDLNDLALGHKVALKFNGKTGKGLASKTVYTKTGPDTWSQDGDPTSFGDKNSQWLKAQKNKSTSLVHEAYPAAPEKPKEWNELQPGDKATGEWSKNVGAGSEVSVTSGKSEQTYKKSSIGTWAGGATTLDEDQMAYALDKINGSGSDYNTTSVVSVQEKTTLGNTPAVPENPDVPTDESLADDTPINDPMAVGGKPETVDHLKQYAEGTTLAYTKKDGSKSTYVKLGSGDYLTPGGQVIAPESFNSAVKQGKFEVASVPAVVAPEVDGLDPKYLTPGEKVDKYGLLKQYPDGTELHATPLGYLVAKHKLVLTKTDGTWYDQFSTEYKPSEFEDDIKKGALYFHSAPKSSVDATAADAPDVHSTVKSITFDNSGQAFSAAELKEAHDALESFSGPQINYGLKSVPDNVFAGDKDMQTKLKAWGKSAYPNLPPKQAAINVLKDKLGLKQEAASDKKNSDAPEIAFGASGDSIKNTPTGLTGGAFSAADVQDAVTILEDFQGKNFKSELNKKNNPLGQLSPNDLVGFNKDKTVTKQKFIDLMKQKLQDYDASQVQEGGPVEDVPAPQVADEPLADWEKELLAPAVGAKFTSTKESLDSLPTGWTVALDTGLTWQKQEDGKWLLDSPGTLPQNSSSMLNVPLTHKGMKSLPDRAAFKPGETFVSKDAADFEKAPKGTVLLEQITDGFETYNMPWTKKDTDYWEDTEGNSLDDADMAKYGPEEGYTVGGSNTDAADAPSEHDLQVAGVGPKSGDPIDGTEEQLDGMPAGTKVKNKFGYEFTKTDDGEWDDGEAPYAADELLEGHNQYDSQYTFAFVPDDSGAWDTETHLTEDDIHAANIGDVVHSTAAANDFTKVGDNHWTYDNYNFTDDEVVEDIISGFTLTWVSKKNSVPSYADAPNAVKIKDHDDATLTGANVDNDPVGKVYAHTDGSLMYVKQGPDNWIAYNKQSGEVEFYVANKSMAQGIDSGDIQNVQYDGPEYNQAGIMPGKYSSGGAAYMVVHADGTGTYVNGKGVASALTSFKVKKNHESGMNYYQGIPDTVPPVPEKPASGAKAKASKLGKVTLEDGTYFNGDPSNAKTATIHVKDGVVTMQKGSPSTPGSALKVGMDADINWAKNAGLGAQVKSQTSSFGFGAYGKVFTKTSDGWKSDDGVVLDGFEDDTTATYYSTIMQHGFSPAEELSNTKVQNLAKKGQLVDKYGNSILPSGYTGEVMFFGSKTSVPNLIAAQKYIDSEEFPSSSKLKQLGVYVPQDNAGKYVKDHFGEVNAANNKAAMQKKISDLLSGVDTDIPESDAADLFTYDSLGNPIYDQSWDYYPSGYFNGSLTEKKNFIKDIASKFGGGGIIGQHLNGMDKSDADAWASYLKNGNFQDMYELEVKIASKKGVPHASGYKHPGYVDNTDTHNVSWGAAVTGEVSALSKVPGTWSDSALSTPVEVDNYLISAQMQNPTHLTTHEKQQWMAYHKVGNKSKVDALSLKAEQSKKNGESPKTTEPSWTENLKPAKAYDILFQDTEFPTQWNYINAQTYMEDHSDLQADYDANHATNMSKSTFLSYHFQAKADAAAAEALVPVYSKDPQQTVKKSTHPIFNYHDQHGNKYYFKPRPDSKEDKYRTEVEHLGNSLGRALGFKTAKSELVTVDGQYGQMQQDVGGVSDFSGFDFKTLTAKQIADIEGEHLLDYFMNNDDAKYDNVKIQADGSVVGIDKARSFGFYGQWDWEGSAADGNTTIYQNMYSAIRSGAFSKEDLDKAYLRARTHAKRISKFDETRLRSMLEDGMQNRTTYNVPYSIDGKQVSQDFNGLVAAVMDRKAKMPDIFEQKWKALYADAGLGDLPDPATLAPEGLVTGLQSEEAHTNMFKATSAGITTQVSGAHVIGGTTVMWTDKNTDGTTNMHGEMFLAPKMQETLNSFFVTNASEVSGEKADPADFSGLNDSMFLKIEAAAKTINTHVGDGAYNEATMSAFQKQFDDMQADLAEWTPNLVSNATVGGEKYYKFASGTSVPMHHVDQYKMAAESYVTKSKTVKEAYDNKTTLDSKIDPYAPVKINYQSTFYTKPDGSTATPIKGSSDNHFLIKDASTGTVSMGTLDGEWNEVSPETTVSLGGNSNITVTKRAYTHEKPAEWNNGVKTTKSSGQAMGSPGQEWEIELEGGEKIFYRNSGLTGTAKAQQGKLVFSANGVENEDQSQAAMSHIMAQLNELGISTEAQTETDAELTYWREMYGILANRAHDKQSNKAYLNAEKDMLAKQKEIGGDENHFLEELDAKMDPEEQAQFWRDLWAKHFGQDKVDDLINNRKYLPKFSNLDYDNPDMATGKPLFERFDVDFDELMKKDWLLATNTGSDPWDRFNSGGLLSAEERLRQLDLFGGAAGGGYNSASTDQAGGGSHYIYARLHSKNDNAGFNVVWSPKTILRTRVSSFNGDAFGASDKRKKGWYGDQNQGAPSDLQHAVIHNQGSGSNETDLPHSASLLNDVEILAFDNAARRNEAIQDLKKRGIDMIRGVPVEDRLIMRVNMKKALDAMKARWAKGDY